MDSVYEKNITRAETTGLIEMYMKCTNDPLSQKGRKCKYTTPMKTFRGMTSDKHMGAVLVGKGPYDKHSENSDMFFNAIKELVDFVEKEEVYKTQQRIISTTMREYCSLSCGEDKHCEFIICPAQRMLWYLSSAINNYLQQTHEHIKEALGDNAHEYNDCSVCKWAGTDQFYYSTIYGLNVPVCSMCVEEKEKEDFEEGEEEEFDEYADHVFVYQEDELEPQTCSVCNYNGCGSFYYSSDNMNEPVCATCETKYRETADCSQRIYHDEYRPTSPQEEYKGTYWYYSYYPLSDIQSCSECMYNGAGFFLTDGYKVTVCYDCGEKVSNSDSDDNDSEYTPSDEEDEEDEEDNDDEEDDDDEEDNDDEEDDDDEEDNDDESEYVPSDEDEDDEDDDFCDDPHCHENGDGPEKFFGCEGCQYEWRDGWQKGWKAAMKQIKKFAKQQKRPENIRIPECAYCGASHNLRKCNGTCEGAVRYCSLVCQKKDWKEGHKHECGSL